MEIVEAIEKRLGKTAEKELLGMQPGDVRETQADIERAREFLNYDPKVRIEEGVDRFITWIEQNEDLVVQIDAVKSW